MDILFPKSVIQDRVQTLAGQLDEHYLRGFHTGAELVMVPVLRGAMMFAGDLAKHMKTLMRVEPIIVESYDNNERSANRKFRYIPEFKRFSDQDILVVDDICDSGWTLRDIAHALQQAKPRTITTVVLLDKMKRRIRPTFCGFTCPDRFVYGYGMDNNGLQRNLPYIAADKEFK